MSKIVQLTDNVLLGFARDVRIRGALPIFDRLYRSIGKTAGGCKCRKRHGTLGGVLASVKKAISVDAGLATRLKQLIGASRLVVHVRDGRRIARKEI